MRKLGIAFALLIAMLLPAIGSSQASATTMNPPGSAVVTDFSVTANAQVCAQSLWLRGSPGGHGIVQLKRRTPVTVLGSEGMWTLVDSPMGRGWVDGRYLC